jgi:hypothetical protein
MRQLRFPHDETAGILDWLGARTDDGPILATGVVEVPDDVEVSLSIHRVQSVERDAFSGGGFITSHLTKDGIVQSEETSGPSWRVTRGDGPPLHLAFLLELPRDGIAAVRIVGDEVLADSFSFLPHLAPGLKRLYLARTDFDDEVLQYVAKLEELVVLQTWGNRFTDGGVQQLGSLKSLEALYLEEETLSPAAFDFVTRLLHLSRLGVADDWSAENVSVLRARFPGLVR